MKFLLKSILFCLLVGMAMACSEEPDCSDNARRYLYCNLYTTDTEYGVAQRDTLDSLSITAFYTDSVILNREANVTTLTIPLRYTADSTELVFHYSMDVTDTLIIRHDNTPYFLSMDCGYQMQHSVTSVSYSRHRLDSIHISNPDANIYGTENLQLYY